MDNKKLLNNILLFTVGLGLLTVAIEMWKKGRLEVEHPLAFMGAIIALGVIGGWVITWVAAAKNK